jgi:glutathione S-transferase
MKLYYSPGACSLSPHICLREARLPFSLVRVDLKEKKLVDDGSPYLPINAKGQVPALELDDGQVLTEGPVIVQYIADQAPESGLAPPAGTLERYRLQSWLNFISAEMHKTFSPLFRPNTPEDFKSVLKTNLERPFGIVEKALADKPYLMGTEFSAADAYLYTILSWAPRVGIDLGRWPNITAYVARVKERPSVFDAHGAEQQTSATA